MNSPLPALKFDLISESQFSSYYTTYNLYLLDYENHANCSGNCSGGDYFSVSDSDAVMKWLLLGVGISAISILGVLGSIFSIIVLLHSRMRSSISCFLIGLAFCDMLILLTTLAMLGLPTLLSFEPWSPGELQVYLKVGCISPWIFGASCTALTGSVYFTLAVTLERYLVVCRPLQARTICTWRRACQAAFFIFLFSAIFSAPKWFEYECEAVNITTRDSRELEGCLVKATEMRKNDYYNFYYVFVGNGLVLYYFPMFVLVALNTLIYRKIKEANNNRRILSPSEAKENSITRMLFVVVAIFILCNLMFAGGIIFKLFTWDKPYMPSTIGLAIATFLVVLNSSLNFLIYCTYGEKFREVLIYMVGNSWKRLSRKVSTESTDSGDRIRTESDVSAGSSSNAISKKYNKSDSLKTLCENV